MGPLKGVHGAKPSEAHGLYSIKGDVFDHFGIAFNNVKFRLFCPYFDHYGLTRTFTSYYLDIPFADGQMVTLLYTLRNFNAERDNNILCMIEVTL